MPKPMPKDKAMAIYKMAMSGEKHSKVAKLFGVARTTVTGIARRRNHSDLPLPDFDGRRFLADKKSSVSEKLADSSKLNPESGCIEWLRAKTKHGYGVIRINQKNHGAHRVAYEIAFGEIADGMFVLHNCDNPSCINPNHLRLGTHSDNMRDVETRKRGTIGEKARHSKLKTEDVLRIKRMILEGLDMPSIAKIFAVTYDSIANIKALRTWSHVKIN